MFLDIAFGIFGSYIVSNFFGETVTLQFIFLGIVFVLLPDLDMFWYKKNKKRDHRSFVHFPLVYIIVSLLLLSFFETKIALLFFITTLFHFIHDTFILGWGVAWFAPFSYRRYKLFPDNGKGGFLQEKYLTWLPDGQKAIEERLHDTHWIKNWYGRVTVVSVIEYSAFVTAIFYVVYTYVLHL